MCVYIYIYRCCTSSRCLRACSRATAEPCASAERKRRPGIREVRGAGKQARYEKKGVRKEISVHTIREGSADWQNRMQGGGEGRNRETCSRTWRRRSRRDASAASLAILASSLGLAATNPKPLATSPPTTRTPPELPLLPRSLRAWIRCRTCVSARVHAFVARVRAV